MVKEIECAPFFEFFLSFAPNYHHANMSVSCTVVKLGFTGVYIILLNFALKVKHRLWVLM